MPSSKSLISILLIAWAPVSCVTPRVAGDPASSRVLSPWEKIPIADGRGVIRRMRARYDGQFVTSLTFRQLNTLYPVSGGEQTHCPALQSCPGKQNLPHVPQFRSSVSRSRHAPAHSVKPLAHTLAQPPRLHTPGAWQRC